MRIKLPYPAAILGVLLIVSCRDGGGPVEPDPGASHLTGEWRATLTVRGQPLESAFHLVQLPDDSVAGYWLAGGSIVDRVEGDRRADSVSVVLRGVPCGSSTRFSSPYHSVALSGELVGDSLVRATGPSSCVDGPIRLRRTSRQDPRELPSAPLTGVYSLGGGESGDGIEGELRVEQQIGPFARVVGWIHQLADGDTVSAWQGTGAAVWRPGGAVAIHLQTVRFDPRCATCGGYGGLVLEGLLQGDTLRGSWGDSHVRGPFVGVRRPR